MTFIQLLRFEYRHWRKYYSRFRAAMYALQYALKPPQF